MKRLVFLCAAIGLVLGSAAPPEEQPHPGPFALPPILVAGPAPQLAPAPPVVTEAPAPVPVPAPPPEPVPARERAEPVAPSGAVRILVSIPAQRAWVFRGSELVTTTPVSTGKRGHPTPTGTFPITQKRVEHYSNLYDNAPMPYMQRLTVYGIALHGGRVPGYPASHGCIRLPHAMARRLYNMTRPGTRVTITRSRPASTRQALALVS